MRALQRALWPILAAGALHACAPYAYQGEVAQFAAGVERSTAGMHGMLDDIADDTLGRERAALADRAPLVDFAGACGAIAIDFAGVDDLATLKELAKGEAARCALSAPDDAGIAQAALEGRSRADVIAERLPNGNVLALIDALSGYGDALAALVGAEDRGELENAWSKAQTSFVDFACNLDQQSLCDGATENAGGALSDGLRALLIAGLDHWRYRRLRDIVGRSDDAIQASVVELRRMQSVIVGMRAAAANERMLNALFAVEQGMDGAAWQAAIDNLKAERQAYLATLQQGTLDTFGQMAVAHAALKSALLDPTGDPSDLRAKIEEFVDYAKQLAGDRLS